MKRMKSLSNGSQDSIDLTSMVDVTFLLLVFFMVTASFIMSSALEQPQVSDLPSPTPTEFDDDDLKITVDITATDEFIISGPDGELIETLNERHFKIALQDVVDESPIEGILIRAHLESRHSKVVTAMDFARTIGCPKIELTTTHLSL